MLKNFKKLESGVSYRVMKTVRNSLLAALMFSGLAGACFAAPEKAVEFSQIKLDSKHAVRASWSLQGDAGVLQIQLPAHMDGEPGPMTPVTRVWLLKADGTSSKPSHKNDSPVGISMSGVTTPYLAYEFARKDVDAAVAIVIQVEKKLFVHAIAQAPIADDNQD